MSRQPERGERFWKHLEPLQGPLEMYCRRSVNDWHAAADVLQTAVTKAYRDFDLFAEGTNFRAWIYRYVNLEVLAASRKAQAQPIPEPNLEPLAEQEWMLCFDNAHFEALLRAPERVLEHCDDVLAGAIAELNALERATLLLKAIGGFKFREIADILETPMGTVMSALARARQRLRHELVEYGRESGFLRAPQPKEPKR